MNDDSAATSELAALERQAAEAAQQGRFQEAADTWTRVLSLRPQHVVALTQLGQHAFRHGDFAAARGAFQRAADADGQDPRQWVSLALACQRQGDDAAQERALVEALSIDPNDLSALLHRGAMYERRGERHRAASAFGAAASVSPPLDRLLPEYRPAVLHAMRFREGYQAELAAFLSRELQPLVARCDGAAVERFQLSLDILVGRKRRYDSQPMRYFVPHLPLVEFFERAAFPWLDEVEAATDAIRSELLAALAQDSGEIAPYIAYGSDQPVAQWAELNHSPRWSAFHLVKDGKPVEHNAARCPATMAAWAHAPVPDQPGRTPVAMFSLLKPRTRIPPHVGASNARLVTHLPLLVPPGCGFRVGNTVREWVPGQAWVFDDTIEHEAWNDSDQLRGILIFDIWHPDLNSEERRMITAMNAALNAFHGAGPIDYDV